MSTTGNGSVYSNGYAIGQTAALKQNEMNNAIGGRKRRTGKRRTGKRRTGTRSKRGGGETVVQPVHAPYPNSGIQALNTDLTKVTAQQQSNAQFDGNVAKGGSRRRRLRRRTNRRRTNRRRTNRRRTNRRRKSRRHM